VTTPNTTSSRVAHFRVFALACEGMWGLLAGRNAVLERPKTATVQAVGAVVSISAWWLGRVASSERRLRVLARVTLAAVTIGVLLNALLNGAMSSTPFILAIVPSMAAYVLGVRDAVAWATLTFLGSAAVIAIGHFGLVRPEFHQGPWEFVLGGFLPLQVSLLVLAVASRRATDAEVTAASRSEAHVRKQSDEIALARDAALQAGRAKSAFLATMSHELRTPLNAIVGMSSVVDETQLTEDQRECIATIRTSGDALLARISDILDFSKIEAGKVELECARVELSHCIEDAVDRVAPGAAEKGVEVTYEIADAVPTGGHAQSPR
jgi:signal transduction histidine kinase